MKNRKNLFCICMLFFGGSFTACSNEENYDVYGDTYNHVFVENPVNTYSFVHTPEFSASTLNCKLPVYCNHRCRSSFSVRLEVDNSLVADYNEKHGTEYAEVPMALLNIKNSEVQFEPNEEFTSVTSFHVMADGEMSELNAPNGYVIPVKMISINGDGVKMIEERSVAYVFVDVKEDIDNIYDEAATPTGTLVGDRSEWSVIVPEGTTQVSAAGTYGGPECMYTGVDDKYWYGRSINKNESLPVIFNLGKPYTFDGLRSSYSSYGYESGTWNDDNIKIEIGNDGVTWEEVGIIVNRSSFIQTFYFPVTAQYVRITMPASARARSVFRCGNFNIYAK